MASLQQESTGMYHIIVRIDGQRFKRSLDTKNEDQAIVRKQEVEETLDLMKRKRLLVPENVQAIDFVMSGGKQQEVAHPNNQQTPKSYSCTLGNLFKKFFGSIPANSIEDSTLNQMNTHKRHLIRLIGSRFQIAKISSQVLQNYISARATEKTQFFIDKSKRGTKDAKRTFVTAATIRKELVTLGTAWRWAVTVPLVESEFPNKGLRFPKLDEKPHFQTWDEIQRQIDLGGFDPEWEDILWSCLFLNKDEVDSLLEHVKSSAGFEFIHPMFAMAAYTSARRSELLRVKISDFDFEGNIVTIHEQKRVKGMRTTRRVPITKTLKSVMEAWFNGLHPGGPFAFVHTQSPRNAITKDQAHCHFKQTLFGSQWEKIKGWHCLRHSFISNLACAGVDQRIIDEFVGHTTEAMRRRYRHLFPNVKQAALESVFED